MDRRIEGRMEGRTDRETLFYRNLLAKASGPKRESNTVIFL